MIVKQLYILSVRLFTNSLFQEEEEEEEGYPYPIGPLPQEVFNDLKSLDEMVSSKIYVLVVNFYVKELDTNI